MKSSKYSNFKLYVLLFFICFIESTTHHGTFKKKFKFVNNNQVISKEIVDYNYDLPVTSEWSRVMAEGYRDMAGLGYIFAQDATIQINEIKKGASKDKKLVGYLFAKLFEIQKWEYISTHTADDSTYNYSFTIIRNKSKKKVICSFSGTKGAQQLIDEMMSSGGVPYVTNPTTKFMIMKYFKDLWDKISTLFKNALKSVIDPSIEQYIFVGHSLGGSIASISVLESLMENIIPQTSNSPVLITYGQPRTGNYAFSNEIFKRVPIVFRHVNNYDMVTKVPGCILVNNICQNEFGQAELNKTITTYVDVKKDGKFYPWHIGGLIYTTSDFFTDTYCHNFSEPTPGICMSEASFDINFHKFYFGFKVSDMWKPYIFGYDIAYRSPSGYTSTLVSKNYIYTESMKNTGVTSKISNSASSFGIWALTKLGWLSKRRKKLLRNRRLK